MGDVALNYPSESSLDSGGCHGSVPECRAGVTQRNFLQGGGVLLSSLLSKSLACVNPHGGWLNISKEGIDVIPIIGDGIVVSPCFFSISPTRETVWRLPESSIYLPMFHCLGVPLLGCWR